MKVTDQQMPAQLLLRWLPSDKSSANIVTLCEDLSSAARAKDFCGQLAAALSPRTVILDSIWNFDLLDRHDRCQIADSDVSGADIIIVSVRGSNRLPAYARSWLEILMRARNGKPGAFVALLGQARTGQHCAVSVDSQLQQLADGARLDYFCSTNDIWNAKLNLSLTPCLAESGNEPIRDRHAFDQYILSLPSITADAGRIGSGSNAGRQTLNGRASEIGVRSAVGRLAATIEPEVVLETA